MSVYEFRCEDCGKELSVTLTFKKREAGGQ